MRHEEGNVMFTTVIGSYPLKYADLGSEAIKLAVHDQLAAGIDLVTDGQTRYDMIEYFARAIEGYTYEGKSVITGKIGRGRPDEFVTDFRLAKSLAPRVKGLITGPVTLVFSSRIKGAYAGYRDENVYLDTAEALLQIARALEAEGAEWIQVDEPFLSVGAPMAIARKAVEHLALGLKVPVAMHVCGSVGTIFPQILEWRGLRLLSHAFMGEKNEEVLGSTALKLSDRMLGLGCIDTKSPTVESAADVAALIRRARAIVPDERLAIHPDCGLRLLPREAVRAKLAAMVGGAREAAAG
jgi:5-methyltetrahydropteroyltriglutamate--homocysteine methyltransferase